MVQPLLQEQEVPLHRMPTHWVLPLLQEQRVPLHTLHHENIPDYISSSNHFSGDQSLLTSSISSI